MEKLKIICVLGLSLLATFGPEYWSKAHSRRPSSLASGESSEQSFYPSGVNIKSIAQYLNDHVGIEMEQFLGDLPANFRSHFTLMHKSFSLQAGQYENPRAILFGEDASLVLRFNGHARQRGGRAVEVLSFDHEKEEFDLYHIEFPYQGNQSIQKNPARCLNCHAAAPKPYGTIKPIWEVYPRWPGAYGSFNDHIFLQRDSLKKEDKISNSEWPPLIEEGQKFFQFKELAKNHPRYQFLVFDDQKKYSPYRDNHAGTEFNNLGIRPNFLLGVLLMGHQTKRLKRLMVETPVFKKFKFSLLSDRLGCSPGVGFSYAHSQFIREELLPILETIYPRPMVPFRDLRKALKKFHFKGPVPPFMYNWNIDFEQTPDSYFNGFTRSEEFFILNTLLLKHVLSHSELLKKAFVVQSWIRNLPSFYRDKKYKDIIDNVTPSHDQRFFKQNGGCRELKRLSELEWNQYKQDKQKFGEATLEQIDPAYYVLSANPEATLFTLTGKHFEPAIVERSLKQNLGENYLLGFKKLNHPQLVVRFGCTDCHAGENKIGPNIGINGQNQNLNWIDSLHDRPIGLRMPRGRRRLTTSEINEFAEYLKNQ